MSSIILVTVAETALPEVPACHLFKNHLTEPLVKPQLCGCIVNAQHSGEKDILNLISGKSHKM